MATLGALLVAVTGTYLLRYGSVRALSGRTLGANVVEALRHASLAMMAALAVASLPTDGGFVLADGATLTGLGVGVVAARRIGDVSIVIVLSVCGYAAVRAIGG